MENKKIINTLKDNNGQGIVEYVMLMVVLASFSSLVLNSDKFKKFLGPDSDFFSAIARKIEFSYRYGHNGVEDPRDNDAYTGTTHLMYQSEAGNSRFTGPLEKYE